MIAFGKHYFYHEGKVYREVKQDLKKKRWKLLDKSGKAHWITASQLKAIIDKLQK